MRLRSTPTAARSARLPTTAAGREKLTAALNQMKTVRGRNNGPPVLGGPLGPDGPTVNGAPVGGPIIQPVNTPPREAHVLNDAILRAALDLSKRDRTRRKVIFVISDGRDLGSKASYRDVLKVLETHGIQVKAVVVDSGALPGLSPDSTSSICQDKATATFFRSTARPRAAERSSANSPAMRWKRHMRRSPPRPGTSTRLAYIPKATAGPAFRSIEVLVDKKGLNIYTKAGYYPVPSAH